MALKDVMRAARVARGWSQSELGRRIGLTAAAVSRIETGTREGALASWRQICFVLDIDTKLVLELPGFDEAETEIEPTPCSP